MAKAEHEATRRVAAKAPMAHQERKWRLALGKTYILELGPLIGTRCYEQEVFWGQDRIDLLEDALKSGRRRYQPDGR